MGKWDFLAPCDAQVQSALAVGDVKQAFEILLQGYQGVVVRYCTTLLDNAADGEDVAQEVFLAILQALPRYEPTALLRTWIFRIARNLCFKYRTKLWRWLLPPPAFRTEDSSLGVEGLPSPEALYHASEEAVHQQHRLDRLEPCLRRLPDRDRLLLMMYYYEEEKSFRAMAQQLLMSEATVRRAVHAAEQKLRTLLLGEEAV